MLSNFSNSLPIKIYDIDSESRWVYPSPPRNQSDFIKKFDIDAVSVFTIELTRYDKTKNTQKNFKLSPSKRPHSLRKNTIQILPQSEILKIQTPRSHINTTSNFELAPIAVQFSRSEYALGRTLLRKVFAKLSFRCHVALFTRPPCRHHFPVGIFRIFRAATFFRRLCVDAASLWRRLLCRHLIHYKHSRNEIAAVWCPRRRFWFLGCGLPFWCWKITKVTEAIAFVPSCEDCLRDMRLYMVSTVNFEWETLRFPTYLCSIKW